LHFDAFRPLHIVLFRCGSNERRRSPHCVVNASYSKRHSLAALVFTYIAGS